MKLISNFKDYYDYLIGAKYGIDPLVVYERICSTEGKDSEWYKSGINRPLFLDFPDRYESWIIQFCGVTYYGHHYQRQFYYGEAAKDQIPYHVDNTTRGICEDEHPNDRVKINKWGFVYDRRIDHNKKEDCPVVLIQGGSVIKNVKLSDYGFARIVPPEDTFLKITDFLSRAKEIVNNQTDKEKIISHGFDTKISFRKEKKKR
jgi:hypothetical protein